MCIHTVPYTVPCFILAHLEAFEIIAASRISIRRCFLLRAVIFYHVNCIQSERFKEIKTVKTGLRDSKLLNMFPVQSYTSPQKINSTHHLEQITVGYSWEYRSLTEQEMAYCSWVDPAPAREVANHMKLVWSSLFAHSNLHRWERMGCWDEHSRALLSPPPLGKAGHLEKSWIHFIHRSQMKICSGF